MKPRIIAIAGNRPRSGKDYAAAYISQWLDTNTFGWDVDELPWRVWTMSNGLQAACAGLWGFTHDQMNTDLKDEVDPRWDLTPRRAMQEMGKVMDGKTGLGLWPHKVRQEMERQPLLIMPGIRVANEDVIPIVRNTGVLLHVHRPFDDDCPPEWKDASIEGAVPYGTDDYVISNSKDLTHFDEQLERFCEWYWEEHLQYDNLWNTPEDYREPYHQSEHGEYY